MTVSRLKNIASEIDSKLADEQTKVQAAKIIANIPQVHNLAEYKELSVYAKGDIIFHEFLDEIIDFSTRKHRKCFLLPEIFIISSTSKSSNKGSFEYRWHVFLKDLNITIENTLQMDEMENENGSYQSSFCRKHISIVLDAK